MAATLSDVELLWAVAIICLGSAQVLLSGLLLEQIFRTGQMKGFVMGLVEDIKALKEQLDKARGEIVAKIAGLEAAVNAAPLGPDPAVLEAVAELKASVQSLDDVVPDAVVESVEAVEAAESVPVEEVSDEVAVVESAADAPAADAPAE